jgi:predicted MFS family arabinose efflux permease
MSNTPINYKIIEADGPSKLVFPLLEPSEVGSNIPNAEFYMLEASIHGAQTPTVRKHSSMSQVSYHDRQEIPNWLLYTMLFSTTIICFGNYYVYDFPQALQTPFNDKLGIGPSDTNLFYSAYGLPNMFLTFFGGVFIQCMGDQKALLTFVTLIVSGQAIFGIGTVMNNYWLMLAGSCLASEARII